MADDGSVVIGVKLDTAKADKELAKMTQKIDNLTAQIDKQTTTKNAISDKLKSATDEAEETRAIIKDIQSEIGRMQGIMSGAIEVDPTEFMKIPEQLERAKAELKVNEDLYKKQEQAVTKLEGEQAKVNQKIDDGTEALRKMQDQAGNLARSIEKQRPFDNISGAIEDARGKLWKFVKYAIGIRTVYALFRKLKSAITDAVKSFATQDKETQTTINNLKASLAALKLSWGAAFAPILNAVAPLLQKLIGWLTTAANAVAQFIAVISGRTTYKRAIANTDKLGKSMQGVGSAAKEAKNQLMGFDDLNILQDNSSDGGGGGGAGLGADVVEEELSPWAEKLKDHLTLIRDLAIGIGAALATWTIAKFLNHVLGLNLAFKQLFGLAVAVGGATVYFLGFVDAFTNGVNWDNTAEMIGGCAAAALGLGLAFGKTGAAVALLVGGFGMLVIGVKDWIRTGQLSTETFWLMEAGILAVGVALALIASPWALLVAGFAAGALAIYKNWNAIEDWWNEKVKPWFTVEKWKELGRNAMKSIKDGLNSISLPKFHFSWVTTGYTANFFGKQFTVKIPFPNLDWYARGGIFDSASIIGVGESGKEAVVPLERNTEWINLVADGLIDRILNNNNLDRLAAAFTATPLPAMAGAVVPPNSLSRTDNSDLQAIRDTLADLRTLLSGRGEDSGTRDFRLYLDGREIYTTVKQYERQDRRSGGW